MKKELLKSAIKKDEYKDIKLTKSDIERLHKIFEEFLEEKDYKSGEEILNIFLSNKIIKEYWIKNHDGLLDKALRIYIEKLPVFMLADSIGKGNYFGEALENLFRILKETNKFNLLNELIDTFSKELIEDMRKGYLDRYEYVYNLDHLIRYIGKYDYEFLKKKIEEYFSQPRKISYLGIYFLIECIKKDDKKIVAFIRNRTITNLKNLYWDLKKFFINTWIISYSIDINNSPSSLITDLKIFDKRKKRDISGKYNLYSFINKYFEDSTEYIYKNLLTLIRKLVGEKEKSIDNLLFYSNFVINSLNRNVSNLGHFEYFIFLLKSINCTNKVEGVFEQIVKVSNATIADVHRDYIFSNDLDYDKASILIQTIQTFMLSCIYSKANIEFLNQLQANVNAYIYKYLKDFNRRLRDIPYIKEEQKISNEKILEILFTIQTSNNIIIENKKYRNHYDTIISDLIVALMKYYKEKITEDKIYRKIQHEKDILLKQKEERDKIIANLSHSIKNLISTVIDPLSNLKEEKKYKDIIIDNALKGADLIREIVNAMNLSYKGSIKDFQYDVKHNVSPNCLSMNQIIVESLKHSVSNMFDSKYFGNFMRNYFPNKKIYGEAKNKWNQTTSIEEITQFVQKYMFDFNLDIHEAKDLFIGNEKGSAIKFQILFQEIILNAVKYVSFLEREKRILSIEFKIVKGNVVFKTENSYQRGQGTKSTGLGHIIIENFAKLLNTNPIIKISGNYVVSISFRNLWIILRKGKK